MKNWSLTPGATPYPGWRSCFTKALAAAGLLSALLAGPAFADEISDVSKLLRVGQYAEAMDKANDFLSRNPRDAQMRFMKGVILTEQNKAAEAIAIFARLTEDFPDLPEPYNNLAVLYAADGEFDKARAALDKAIRTNPAYATAYENLGDVHAKLASQAYDKALQLDSKNSGAKSKLTLVRSLVDTSGGAVQVASAPVRKAAAPSPATVPAPAAGKKVTVPPAPVPDARPAQVASSDSGAIKAAPMPAQKPAQDNNAERAAILNTVTGWAKAWSAQDMTSYLGYYSDEFDTPKGMSRKAWTAERRARIVGKDRITVKVESPQVVVNGNKATVKFHQSYVSDRFTSNSRKTLELIRNGGKWQIRQERVGN